MVLTTTRQPRGPNRRRFWVHLEAKGVVLFQQRTPESAWETACAAPCDIRLPNAFHYRAGGGGLSFSPDFTLDAPPGTRETVVVARAGKAALVLGIVLLSAGPVVNLVGWGLVLGALNGDGHEGSTATVGFAVAGTGSLMVIAGLVLTIMNAGSHADVSQELEPSPASLLSPGSWAADSDVEHGDDGVEERAARGRHSDSQRSILSQANFL